MTDQEHAVAPDAYLECFAHNQYLIRRKVFKLVGGAFHVFDNAGQVILYSKMKAFKLREDIRLYESEAMQTELIRISTESILDFSGAYDVFDSVSGERVGTVQRAGMTSTFVRDKWAIYDGNGHEIGSINEDSTFKALVRRFVEAAATFMPQAYHIDVHGQRVGTCKQNFNPFVHKLNVDFSDDPNMLLDRRLGLAAAILLCAIEGRQN